MEIRRNQGQGPFHILARQLVRGATAARLSAATGPGKWPRLLFSTLVRKAGGWPHFPVSPRSQRTWQGQPSSGRANPGRILSRITPITARCSEARRVRLHGPTAPLSEPRLARRCDASARRLKEPQDVRFVHQINCERRSSTTCTRSLHASQDYSRICWTFLYNSDATFAFFSARVTNSRMPACPLMSRRHPRSNHITSLGHRSTASRDAHCFWERTLGAASPWVKPLRAA